MNLVSFVVLHVVLWARYRAGWDGFGPKWENSNQHIGLFEVM